MSDTYSDETKTTHVLSYSRKANEWEMWKEKHLAIAYQCGYQEILMGGASVNPNS